MMTRSWTNSRGMTLTELITVMAIISILAAIGVPQFNNWIHKYRLEGQVNKLYFDLMAAKSQAIRFNHNMVVTFNAGNHTYKIHSDKDNDGVEDTGENVKTVILENGARFGTNGGLATDVWGNSMGGAVNMSNGGSSVTFDSRGQANTSGAVYLMPDVDLSTTMTDRARAIKIVQTTGNIEVMRYDKDSNQWS